VSQPTFDLAAPACLRSELIEALADLNVWPVEIFSGQDEGENILAESC
jgi:hypothetical protein